MRTLRVAKGWVKETTPRIIAEPSLLHYLDLTHWGPHLGRSNLRPSVKKGVEYLSGIAIAQDDVTNTNSFYPFKAKVYYEKYRYREDIPPGEVANWGVTISGYMRVTSWASSKPKKSVAQDVSNLAQ